MPLLQVELAGGGLASLVASRKRTSKGAPPHVRIGDNEKSVVVDVTRMHRWLLGWLEHYLLRNLRCDVAAFLVCRKYTWL